MVLWCALSALLGAALATSRVVPWVTRLAHRFDALDHPGGRKLHAGPVPRLGGIAIVIGIVFGALIGFGSARVVLGDHWLPDLPTYLPVALGFGALIVFTVGVWDDVHGVSVPYKFLLEFVAALIVVGVGQQIESVRLPFTGPIELGMLTPVISLLWIVGVTNAINLIEGLDGLAGGITAIVSVSLMLLAILQGNPGTVLIACAIAGSCLGFLRHNWEPAKIYLGDSGSLTLGFLLASVSLYSSMKASTAVVIFVPLLALGLPVIDTVLVMGVRFLERSGDSLPQRFARMFQADRKHVHHLALALAPSRSRIVLFSYVLVAFFCALALFMVKQSWGLWIAVTLLAIELGAIVLIRYFGMRVAAQKLAQAKREKARKRLVESSRHGEQQDDSLADSDPLIHGQATKPG